MIRKYLFYMNINDGFIYVVINEGINVEVFYQYFIGLEVLKIKSGVLRYIAGVIIFNPTVGLW